MVCISVVIKKQIREDKNILLLNRKNRLTLMHFQQSTLGPHNEYEKDILKEI